MPLLTRKKVLTIDRNRIATLPTTLGSALTAENIPIDAVGSIDAERIDRTTASTTLTALKDLAGQKAIEFTFGLEMKGSNNGTAEPEWGRVLEGCGFVGEAVEGVDVSAQAGTFRHLETLSFAPSGATATCVSDQHDGTGATRLIFYNLTGVPTGTDTVTGSDSGATASVDSAATDEGYGWWPVSSVEKVILFDSTGLLDALSVGDLIEGTVSGARGVVTRDATVSTDTLVYYTPVRGTFAGSEQMARVNPNADADIGSLNASTGESFTQFPPMGVRLYTDGKSMTGNACRANVVFNMEVNRPVRMDFTYRGTLEDVDDRVLLTGIDYENTDPPLWESSQVGYAQNETGSEDSLDDEFEPCITTMSVDMGNQLADRKCVGAQNGLLEVAVSQRDGSGSMTVEDTLEADIGWLTRIQDNETVRLRTTIGGVDGNRFTISMPGIQFTAHSEGDTDGIVTQDMTFRLTGGNLFDITPDQLSSTGGDNEIVIIYHTA